MILLFLRAKLSIILDKTKKSFKEFTKESLSPFTFLPFLPFYLFTFKSLPCLLLVQLYQTVEFKVGDTVQITAGPLEGFMGLVEGIDTESFKVKLKVNMFGRETPAEVDIAQVELP